MTNTKSLKPSSSDKVSCRKEEKSLTVHVKSLLSIRKPKEIKKQQRKTKHSWQCTKQEAFSFIKYGGQLGISVLLQNSIVIKSSCLVKMLR